LFRDHYDRGRFPDGGKVGGEKTGVKDGGDVGNEGGEEV
jgi:hypothetical protein